jgi:hypothetical protein
LFQVCKKFYEVTKSAELYRNFDVGPWMSIEAAEAFLMQRGHHLWRLEVAYVEDDSTLIRTAAKNCPDLKRLQLWSENDSKEFWEKIATGKYFPKLKELDLANEYFDKETMVMLFEKWYKFFTIILLKTVQSEGYPPCIYFDVILRYYSRTLKTIFWMFVYSYFRVIIFDLILM